MASYLQSALEAVDWNANVSALCINDDLAGRIELCNMRLALWASQIESIDKGNPALPFVREMQHGGHSVAACVALALYKPAASAMRAIVECALYYTYFRTHPAELSTLLVDERYYVSKKDIIDFYKIHIRDFRVRQNAINVSDRLERWYSKTSAIVHGQIPGQWTVGISLAEMSHQDSLLGEVVAHFEAAVSLVNDIFLCVLGAQLWSFLDSEAKKLFLSGVSGDAKATLKLDAA